MLVDGACRFCVNARIGVRMRPAQLKELASLPSALYMNRFAEPEKAARPSLCHLFPDPIVLVLVDDRDRLQLKITYVVK